VTEPVLVDIADGLDDFDRAVASGLDVVVVEGVDRLDSTIAARMVAAASHPGVASASPVPAAGVVQPTDFAAHPAAPPAPSVPLPCTTATAFSASALSSTPVKPRGSNVAEAVLRLGEVQAAHGWRHVACPGVAYDWDPTFAGSINPNGGWSAAAIEALAGPGNVGLEAHRSWARAVLGGTHVVIDGACLTAEPGTGTQHLVLEVSKGLAATRPRAKITLAVPPSSIEAVRREVDAHGVSVVKRSNDIDADVLYRPYQMLFAGELDMVLDVGRRTVVGQLDMIGFGNFAYHPSDDLAFFARNLQRFLMRRADAVTFISEYGRQSAFAECPDLDEQRMHVVSCGADPRPRLGESRLTPIPPAGEPFLTCLASTFWHKNRAHAVATFAELVRTHHYPGHLVIVGHEPYFGRSTAAEDELLAALPDEVAARVQRLGHVNEDEKWWLLRCADAVLYPSIVEGFGLVPFEAAAVGTPCLSFAGTAQGELLGGTDAVIDDWHVDRWAERIAGWLHDDAAAVATVDAVRRVAELYTWEACAERTWQAIDDALARPRRSVHGEDGGMLTHVAAADRRRPFADVRFAIARGGPAIGRRLRRARSDVRTRLSR
jgi:glycosyltransferase involved in cell wall biosynthesis